MTIQLHGLKTTGLVPIGGVVATIPALAGAYACSATTAADDLGYVVCGGQVINDATSPLNGRTIPNINSDVFLKGHTTSNTAGGSNTHDHTVPGHYHYYGQHWTNDNALDVYNGNGDGGGNTYRDGYGYGSLTNDNGWHNHGYDDVYWTSQAFGNWGWRGIGAAEDTDNAPGATYRTTHHNGTHSHHVYPHRHYMQTRTTHGGGLDGRNTMTSGSSSTQPKFITVLYVMRIK